MIKLQPARLYWVNVDHESRLISSKFLKEWGQRTKGGREENETSLMIPRVWYDLSGEMIPKLWQISLDRIENLIHTFPGISGVSDLFLFLFYFFSFRLELKLFIETLYVFFVCVNFFFQRELERLSHQNLNAMERHEVLEELNKTDRISIRPPNDQKHLRSEDRWIRGFSEDRFWSVL